MFKMFLLNDLGILLYNLYFADQRKQGNNLKKKSLLTMNIVNDFGLAPQYFAFEIKDFKFVALSKLFWTKPKQTINGL